MQASEIAKMEQREDQAADFINLKVFGVKVIIYL